jgi:hypothetical protein
LIAAYIGGGDWGVVEEFEVRNGDTEPESAT